MLDKLGPITKGETAMIVVVERGGKLYLKLGELAKRWKVVVEQYKSLYCAVS